MEIVTTTTHTNNGWAPFRVGTHSRNWARDACRLNL